VDPGLQLLVELALGADRVQHRRPALLQLAQVAQALFEGAQLGVVQPAGGLLAVPGDERDGAAVVEEPDRGGRLVPADAELLGDPLFDRGGHDALSNVVEWCTPHSPGAPVGCHAGADGRRPGGGPISWFRYGTAPTDR